MSTVLEPPPPLERAADGEAAMVVEVPPPDTPAVAAASAEAESTIPTPPVMTVTAAALSAAGALWMLGGIFRDPLARAVGIVGVLLALGMLVVASRLQRASRLQYLVLPVAVVAGALMLLPQAGAGSSSIPALVVSALRNGGLLQPPIAFDPGWRLILVVLGAGAAAAGGSLALATNRPRLGVLVPLPITVLSAIVQPESAVFLSAAGAVVLTGGALTVAYGAELSRASGTSFQFERSRLLRGAALIVALAVGLGGLSRAGILFPEPQRNYVIPPHKPQTPPPVKDHVLFTVHFGKLQTALRLGVLDTYDTAQQAWLLPPYDSKRLVDVGSNGQLPSGSKTGSGIRAEITVVDLGGQHGIPTLPSSSTVSADSSTALQYDPETQDLQLRDRPAFGGFTYTLTAAQPPSAPQLRGAAAPPRSIDGVSAQTYLAVPPAPTAIQTLLAHAPRSGFDRMQFLRQNLYSHVVAAGTGVPVDVSATRVAQMLNGSKATPYEITAAEALLARYAGVPARLAYGYLGGSATPDGALAVHPSNGSAWLEAYFSGYGWVPIIGQPPHAQASLDQTSQPNPAIHPSDQLSLVVYVPVRVHTYLALYEQIRYWIAVALPPIVLLALLFALFPAGVKRLRSRQRRRWAMQRGVRARIGVAYAELRDRARDLSIGVATATPLAFVESLEPDEEHEELAFLVTRAMWGDLRRDLRPEDAAEAERMAQSVARRMTRPQPFLTRFGALVARTSLRDPYTREIPNLWPEPRPARAARPRWTLRRRHHPRVRRATAGVLAGAVLAGLLGITGAAKGSPPSDPGLSRLVPPSIGALAVRRETAAEGPFQAAGPDALVSTGQVYTLRQGQVVQGSVQVSRLKPGISTTDEDLVHGLQGKIGSGDFTDLQVRDYLFDGHCRCAGEFHSVYVEDTAAHGYQKVWVANLPDQRIYFWFPPGGQTLAITVVRSALGTLAADDVVLSVIDFEHGYGANSVPLGLGAAPQPAPASSAASIGTAS